MRPLSELLQTYEDMARGKRQQHTGTTNLHSPHSSTLTPESVLLYPANRSSSPLRSSSFASSDSEGDEGEVSKNDSRNAVDEQQDGSNVEDPHLRISTQTPPKCQQQQQPSTPYAPLPFALPALPIPAATTPSSTCTTNSPIQPTPLSANLNRASSSGFSWDDFAVTPTGHVRGHSSADVGHVSETKTPTRLYKQLSTSSLHALRSSSGRTQHYQEERTPSFYKQEKRIRESDDYQELLQEANLRSITKKQLLHDSPLVSTPHRHEGYHSHSSAPAINPRLAPTLDTTSPKGPMPSSRHSLSRSASTPMGTCPPSPGSLRARRLGLTYTRRSPLLLRVCSSELAASVQLSPRPHTARAAPLRQQSTPAALEQHTCSPGDGKGLEPPLVSMGTGNQVAASEGDPSPTRSVAAQSKLQHEPKAQNPEDGVGALQRRDGNALGIRVGCCDQAGCKHGVSVDLRQRFDGVVDDLQASCGFMSAQSSLDPMNFCAVCQTELATIQKCEHMHMCSGCDSIISCGYCSKVRVQFT